MPFTDAVETHLFTRVGSWSGFNVVRNYLALLAPVTSGVRVAVERRPFNIDLLFELRARI